MIITFIGMPASGKTSIGRALAKRLGIKFIDGDRLIEAKMGKKLHEIIAEVGNEGFKKIEEETLLSVENENAVISPGGSAVYYESVMRHFKERGLIVYLHASSEVIKARLGDFSKRGVVLEDGKTIDDLYLERKPLYEKYADITITCNGNAFGRYQKMLLHKLEPYFKKK